MPHTVCQTPTYVPSLQYRIHVLLLHILSRNVLRRTLRLDLINITIPTHPTSRKKPTHLLWRSLDNRNFSIWYKFSLDRILYNSLHAPCFLEHTAIQKFKCNMNKYLAAKPPTQVALINITLLQWLFTLQ